ncbi:MAG TPA: hypothetical protein VN625_00445 [Desulfuromonadaceae bacterium]|nr:hypothetical protein [Desulfuromonadaceae bacterium]
MLLFKPFKDNRPWRRVLSVICGCALVVWGLVSIYKGHITAISGYNHTFYMTDEPFGFWLVVAVILYLGVGCIYRGIRGKRDED